MHTIHMSDVQRAVRSGAVEAGSGRTERLAEGETRSMAALDSPEGMKEQAVMKHIIVLAAETQEELERLGASVEQECDTIAAAKKRAKYYLTEEYMNVCESSTRLGYAQVKVDGEVHSDFFGK